jgi:hypothetical protein
VLIVVDSGADQSGQRIEEELSLVGIESEAREGSRDDAQLALRENGTTAVVHLREDGATIWVRKQGSHETEPIATEVSRHPNESPELLALRSAELLRGQLLPAEEERRARSPRAGAAPGPSRIASFTTGPALLYRSYGGVAPGWTGDGSLWFGRWGFGTYVTAALTRSDWTPEAKNALSFHQLGAGAQVRLLIVQSRSTRFEAQAIARLGLASLSLLQESGPPKDRIKGKAVFLDPHGGVEATWRLAPWLLAGVQALGGAHLSLSWPDPKGESPAPGEAGRVNPERPRGPLGHATLAGVATAHF